MQCTGQILLSTRRAGIYRLDEVAPEPDIRHWTFDPGRTNLLAGMDYKLTRSTWRMWLGTDDRQRRVSRRNARVGPILNALAQHSLKTQDVGRLSLAIQQRAANWQALWAHFGHRFYQRLRFEAHVAQQRALDRVANEVFGKDRDRIAVIGDGLFPASVRGGPSAPVVSLRERLARRGIIVVLDEWGTTVYCCICESRMVAGDAWSVFHCHGCGHTWNRDDNAPRNQELVYVAHMDGQPRPAYLVRR